jgi:hypothetical protein
MAPPGDAVLAFASGVPLLVLGIFLASIHPRRGMQRFFAAFVILWGLQILLANLGRLFVDPAIHRTSLLFSYALLPPMCLFLVQFAMDVEKRRYDWIASLAAGLLAAGALLVLIIDPRLVIHDVVLRDGGLHTAWGALTFPLFQAPLFAAFLLAVLVLYVEYRKAKPGTPRHRVRGILLALALYVSYLAARNGIALLASVNELAAFASGSVRVENGIGPGVQAGIYGLGALLLIGMVAHMLARPLHPEGRDPVLLIAFVFPAGTAIFEQFVNSNYNVPLETLGFWRLVAVGVIVYTLANYQLFDMELKLKRFASPVVAFLLILLGIPIALGFAIGEVGFQAIAITVITQILGVAGVAVFHTRIEQALFPGVVDTPDYLHQRRLEIYRVALEDALARGVKPDDLELRELRLRNQISDEEHKLLVWITKPKERGGQRGAQAYEPGAVALERYRLDKVLGSGTYGRTFLATDLQVKTEVALKTVDLETFDGAAAKLLLREARLAASISHPFVINILDVAELPDRVVVVMEYADNGNLEKHLKKHGRLTLPEGVRFLRELLMALEAVHGRGIVHRNLKPKNILIEADNSVRLSDFGAATPAARQEDPAEAASRTLVNLLYQSPEQLGGEPATPQSDLFVAALLFHEAITGRLPYPLAGKNDYQIRETIRNTPPTWHLDDQPPWVEAFLARAMAREPSARFETAAIMRRDFEEAAGLSGATTADAAGQPRPDGSPSPGRAPRTPRA